MTRELFLHLLELAIGGDENALEALSTAYPNLVSDLWGSMLVVELLEEKIGLPSGYWRACVFSDRIELERITEGCRWASFAVMIPRELHRQVGVN